MYLLPLNCRLKWLNGKFVNCIRLLKLDFQNEIGLFRMDIIWIINIGRKKICVKISSPYPNVL